jgi:hypothetical protein
MSICHKAYLFRFDEFEAELSDILYDALGSGDVEPLRAFIHQHRAALTDLWTAEPLPESWEDRFLNDPNRKGDVQAYADVALTKYYNLTEDWGLIYQFDALGAYLKSVPEWEDDGDTLICGYLFGPGGKRLDPGRMGTGIVPTAEAADLAERLRQTDWPAIPEPGSPVYEDCGYQPESVEEVRQARDQLVALYLEAEKSGCGVLLADFNDRGVSRL